MRNIALMAEGLFFSFLCRLIHVRRHLLLGSALTWSRYLIRTNTESCVKTNQPHSPFYFIRQRMQDLQKCKISVLTLGLAQCSHSSGDYLVPNRFFKCRRSYEGNGERLWFPYSLFQNYDSKDSSLNGIMFSDEWFNSSGNSRPSVLLICNSSIVFN